MKSGRELDALVAEKVMVINIERDLTGYNKPTGMFLVSRDPFKASEIPSYSTDIACAWEVVDKLQGNDWAFTLDNMKDRLGNWQAQFERGSAAFASESESAPHAICLAALKAVGVEV